MSVFRSLVIGVVLFGVGAAAYVQMPKEYRYELGDWFTRLTAQDFDWPPDDFSAREQGDFIAELQRRNYEPKCYGGLQAAERMGTNDDYQCWFIVKNAFESIPARMVTVSFSKGRLDSVAIKLPESSFPQLFSYLERRLARFQRIDEAMGKRSDIFGKPLAVWAVNHGFVTTSAQPTEGKLMTVFWSTELFNTEAE